MKLFVVGSASPNPADWSREPDGFALMLAGSAADALQMAEEQHDCPVCEVPMNAPLLLVSMAGADVLKEIFDQAS